MNNKTALYWIDNQWQSLEVYNADKLDEKDAIDFSLVEHKHFKSDITDLPKKVSVTQDGFMSTTDKIKLDTIAINANNYIHPNDAGTRHASDTEKAKWNATAVQSLDVYNIINNRGFNGACTIVSDWNAIASNGFYMSSSAANAPDVDWWMGYTMVHNSLWAIQVLNRFNNDRKWKQRFKINGTWTEWSDFGGGGGGDIMGTQMLFEAVELAKNVSKTCTNSKGGIVRITPKMTHTSGTIFTIVVDGTTIYNQEGLMPLMGVTYNNNYDKPVSLDIPFDNSFSITASTTAHLNFIYYLNK